MICVNVYICVDVQCVLQEGAYSAVCVCVCVRERV